MHGHQCCTGTSPEWVLALQGHQRFEGTRCMGDRVSQVPATQRYQHGTGVLHGHRRCVGAGVAQTSCTGASTAWVPALCRSQRCMGASVARAPMLHQHRVAWMPAWHRSVAWAPALHGHQRCMGTSVTWVPALHRPVAWVPASHGHQRCMGTSVAWPCQRCACSGARWEPGAVRQGRAALGVASPDGSDALCRSPGAGEVPPPVRGLRVPELGDTGGP